MNIQSFKSIVHKYEVIFFDAYGVLKNSQGLIPGIHGTFDYLIKHNIDFYILTNDASRGPIDLAKSYRDAGLLMINERKIISSGMLAREYVRLKVGGGRVAYLGTVKSAHYLEQPGLETVSIADVDLDHVDDINALVFLDDEGFDWNKDLSKIVNLLRKRNIPSIVANTDMVYPISSTQVSLAIGSIADMIERVTGRKFIHFGKPDAQMFIFAYEHTKKAMEVGKEKILMVGDTLFTDIIGGNKFGIDTALVLTGNTLEVNLKEAIHALGILPDYVCSSAVIEE